MQEETGDQIFQTEVICRKNAPVGLWVDRSAEMIEDCTEAEGRKGNSPEPGHAVEKVLLKVIVFFSIDGPRNDEAGKDKKNDNIVLSVFGAQSTDMPAKEPIKIGMAEEHCDSCGKP